MAKLYIIGNGFDIAHGLNTSYWNFRSFLEETDYEFLIEFEKLYNIHPLDCTEYGYTETAQKKWNDRVYDTLWSEFEKSMGFPDIQAMLDFSESVLGDLDLESGNIGIIDTMNSYWKQQFGFINKLQNYVKEWISSIDLSHVKTRKNLLLNNDEDYFLNFNYTRVLEDIYQADHVLHIHGSIGHNSDTSPFMGHCNQEDIDEHLQHYHEYFDKGYEGEASIHSAVADYLTSIFKDTSQYIRINQFFFNRLSLVDEVIILGWSIGDVDIPYLNKICNSIKSTTKWTVYYYDCKAYHTIHKALLENNIIDKFHPKFIKTDDFWDKT